MSRRARRQARQYMDRRQATRFQQAETAQVLAQISETDISPDCTFLEAERQYAVLIQEQYGCLPVSGPFYLRHLGLNDHRRGTQNDLRHDQMPDVIRLRRTP